MRRERPVALEVPTFPLPPTVRPFFCFFCFCVAFVEESLLVGLRWADTAGNMTVVNFTKKNTLTGGTDFFVSTPFCETKSTD